MQIKTRKQLIWMFVRTGLVLVALIVCTASFAWFRAAGAQRVGTEPLSISAAEAEIVEISGGSSISMRGAYRGETGLGAEGTRDMPFFVSKTVSITFTPVVYLTGTKTPVPYTSIKSIKFGLTEYNSSQEVYTTYLPALKQVQATYAGDTLLDTDTLETDSRKAVFDSFCWRVALLQQPHVKGTKGTAIDNPSYVKPEALNQTITDTASIRTLYNHEVELVLDLRLYFLDVDSLAATDLTERTPFRFSGYDMTLHDYTDMSYSGADFAFDYDIGVVHSCVRLVETPSTGGGA